MNQVKARFVRRPNMHSVNLHLKTSGCLFPLPMQQLLAFIDLLLSDVGLWVQQPFEFLGPGEVGTVGTVSRKRSFVVIFRLTFLRERRCALS